MDRKISFGDLKIGDTARRYMQRALDKHWVSEGVNVREFEQKFAQKFGYKHAIATSSGTDADTCCCASLYEYGAQRGDEIIVPACCFVACPNSILTAGFTPKFVDIEIDTLNIDPERIEATITKKTRGIMMVYTMGKMHPVENVANIARHHGLKVIEDACEAHGAEHQGKLAGTVGDMGTFSFYAAHLMICGEGGMVVTDNEELAGFIRSIKSHGRPAGSLYFDFQRIGFNSKMNDMEAAIGLQTLEEFDENFAKRRSNLLNLLMMTSDLSKYCYFLKEEPFEVVSPFAFPIVLRDKRFDRDGLYRYLESRGIQCKTLFGSLPTQHRAFEFLGHKMGDFPVSEYVGENGLQFGVHRYLSDDDLAYIADTLKEYFRRF